MTVYLTDGLSLIADSSASKDDHDGIHRKLFSIASPEIITTATAKKLSSSSISAISNKQLSSGEKPITITTTTPTIITTASASNIATSTTIAAATVEPVVDGHVGLDNGSVESSAGTKVSTIEDPNASDNNTLEQLYMFRRRRTKKQLDETKGTCYSGYM